MHMYRIYSNKRPGTYFLHGLQAGLLNETGRSFEARQLLLIAYFEGTVDLRRWLIAAHLRDLRPPQRWLSFAFREHLFRSCRVAFLYLMLQ